ncbi:MAG: Uma2 family endonuclease [Gemmataceae bacterium]|nr:Uma2 family endonuclease [Gemmataceae bacterium]
MSAVPKPNKLTEAEYLERERRADTRSEFYDGVMYAMAGARLPHNLVKDNLARELGNQFKGGPCRAVTSDMRVKVRTTGYQAYPDVAVYCGPPEFDGDRDDILVNPRVLVEVLSDSTERHDRTFKFRQYQRVPSFREYVLVAQDEPAAERYVRQEDGSWARTDFVGLDAVLALATVPAAVRLADIYAGVTFPEDTGGRPGDAAPPAPAPK